MGSSCYSFVYPQEYVNAMHISQLEAWNCLIAARHFLREVHDECIEIRCDNDPALSSLASGRGRDPMLLAICRAFWYFGAVRNIRFLFSYVPGELMTVADALSRRHLSNANAARADEIIEAHGLISSPIDIQVCDIQNYF